MENIEKNIFPAADIDLWYRMVEKDYIILSIPEVHFQYRVHSGADSSKNFLTQRLKTHFANYNMRLRRSGKCEISYEYFLNNIWAKVSYKYPRMWRNYSKFFYKKAATEYMRGNLVSVFNEYIYFAFN